jgi:hypothetical protein
MPSTVNAVALGVLEVAIAKPIPIAAAATKPIITHSLIFLSLVAFLARSSRSFALIYIQASKNVHINDYINCQM